MDNHKNYFEEKWYKLNDINQFQVKNWFEQTFFLNQQLFSTDVDEYNRKFTSETFTESKKKFYGKLNFDWSKYSHILPTESLMEWNGLNHPPFSIDQIHNLESFSKVFYPIDYTEVESLFFDDKWHEEVDKKTGTHLSFGNKLKILNNEESYFKKIELIREAKKSIWISSLIMVCDTRSKNIRDEIILRAKDGLDIRMIVEGSITKFFHNQCTEELRENGIEVIYANDFLKFHWFTIYHSKQVIIDSEKGIIGGQNIIDSNNLSKGTDFLNRDTDLSIEGPAITDMMKSFIDVWTYFQEIRMPNNKYITSLKNYLPLLNKKMEVEKSNAQRGVKHYSGNLNDKNKRMKGVCRYIMQTPYDSEGSIAKTYLEYLDVTKKYLLITDPLKVDNTDSSKPLIETFDSFKWFNKLHSKVFEIINKKNIKLDYLTTVYNRSGNEVVAIKEDILREKLSEKNFSKANRIIKSIKKWNKFYGKPSYENLLLDYYPNPNIQVWNHISFLHSKMFYFDRIALSVGSYNFQHNATDHSYESTIICQDEKLNKKADRSLVLDMANSIPFIFKDIFRK